MKIAQKSIKFILIVAVALFTSVNFAAISEKKQDDQNDGGRVNTKEEVDAKLGRRDVLYVQNDKGEFIPVWRTVDF